MTEPKIMTVIISTAEKGDLIQKMNVEGNLHWQNVEGLKILGIMVLAGEWETDDRE